MGKGEGVRFIREISCNFVDRSYHQRKTIHELTRTSTNSLSLLPITLYPLPLTVFALYQ